MDTKVTLHEIEGLPKSPIEIIATGPLGLGQDHSAFMVKGLDISKHPLFANRGSSPIDSLSIIFQNGPIPAAGHNGVSIEHLLAICGHRLEEFQAGPFTSEYNAKALQHIKDAIAALSQRTLDRIARDVEGSYEK